MTGADTIAQFGLAPSAADRPALIAALERCLAAGGADDEDDMHALCCLLFLIGDLDDVPLLWRAKTCNFDKGCYLDIELLLGAGLQPTRAWLQQQQHHDILERLRTYEKSQHLIDFTVAHYTEAIHNYYST